MMKEIALQEFKSIINNNKMFNLLNKEGKQKFLRTNNKKSIKKKENSIKITSLTKKNLNNSNKFNKICLKKKKRKNNKILN